MLCILHDNFAEGKDLAPAGSFGVFSVAMVTDAGKPKHLTSRQLEAFHRDGYAVVQGLFSVEELTPLSDYFFGKAVRGEQVENFWHPDPVSEDPLERFPRVMHPHRWNGPSKAILLDSRLERVLWEVMEEEPLAVQSMYYFKPSGARGQALHQDNRALQVRPKTCMAAWISIDPSTEENGCLYVVPGSHIMELVCPHKADRLVSSTSHALDVPDGMDLVPVPLNPGDVLFFNGSLIHGSNPNHHHTLWRRSYILHYIPKSSLSCAAHFCPAIDFGDNQYTVEATKGGGPCGGEYLPRGFASGAY